MDMKECILLLRVSTEQQDYDSQLDDLVKYSKSKGYEKYYIINDKESGVKLSEEERNGLNEMKELISSNPNINGVCVWELSRLSRQQKILFSIRDYLVERNINIHIFDRKCDVLDSEGNITEAANLLFSIYAYYAEQEAKSTKLRTKRGKQYKNSEGKFVGGKLHFGYTVGKDKTIIINEDEANIIKEIFNKYLNTDISSRQLAKDYYERGIIKAPTFNTARGWMHVLLQNEAYCGGISYKKGQIMPNKYPQIIPSEWIQQAKEKLSKGTVCPRTTDNIYYCKSLIKNSNGMVFQTNVWDCRYFTNKPYMTLPLNLIDSIAWTLVKFIIYPIYLLNQDTTKMDEIKHQIKVNEEKIVNQSSKIEATKNEMERLKNLYIKGFISEKEFEVQFKNKENDIKTLSKQINDLTNANIQLDGLINGFRRDSVTINDICAIKDDKERQKLIKEVITSIDVDDNKVMVFHTAIGKDFEVRYKKIRNHNFDVWIDGKKEFIEYEERFKCKNRRRKKII